MMNPEEEDVTLPTPADQHEEAEELSAHTADLEETNLDETESDEDADQAGEPVREKASPAARKLEPLVLAHVLRPQYQPVKPRVIAKQLKLPTEQHQALKICIRRLVKAGKLSYGSGHIVRPPVSQTKTGPAPVVVKSIDEIATQTRELKAKPKHEKAKQPERGLVTGKFRRAAKGFGFVRPLGTPRSAERTHDIFIPLKNTADAATGDTVIVRISRNRDSYEEEKQPKISGEIIKVAERSTHQFVGVYKEDGDVALVDVDAKIFANAVPVGDPGAKGAAPGDKVVIEMVQFPSHYDDGEAVITEVLGKRGDPGIDTLSILREFALPEAFPEEVIVAAREEAEKFDEAIGDRLDLTETTIVTIDPVDARDFDDAISLTKLDNDHWQLGVHIADVSHFVQPRSPLDREARERATSVYLPDRVIPMLPEVISNNLASLQPNKVRYTQTAMIEFNAVGVPVHAEFHRSAIKSCRRFAYEEVDEYLANPEPWRTKLTPAVFELLGRMHELAMILRKRRLDAGAIELTLPEVKIDLDRRGEVVGAHKVVNTVSHQIIEEFMLAANEATARLLFDRELPFLRRIHEQPDLRKLQALNGFIKELGIECEDLHSRFEIKRVIGEVAGHAEEHAVNYAVLRSMQKAVYSPVEEGHYALNSDHYCHFTSPIRRYPDLTIHRMIEAICLGKKPLADFDRQMLLGEHCSEREQRAEKAERELTKMKLLTFLAKKIGMRMPAVITGVEEYGLFAQGIDMPAEGMIRLETLGDDFYRYDAATHSLVGYRAGNRFRLGDRIEVQVAHVDVDRRELDFRVAKRVESDVPRRGGPSLGGGRRPKHDDAIKDQRRPFRSKGGGAGKPKPKGKRRRD
ncbi:Ribonuclease R [Anatilimnocola aggregata]|uniref:Ribonuclease R n=1 Tax=Anatilimnocola aggregata TaxID=2528021 RepID=A0A517YP05_9BACT|nr:ribonuclease R [Anatilimnocola aggregata]QDU31950.1 Ribonuclease R [Anatilimnocola aggregata]